LCVAVMARAAPLHRGGKNTMDGAHTHKIWTLNLNNSSFVWLL